MVKNLPANAGDMGSIPHPGRSRLPQETKPMLNSTKNLRSNEDCAGTAKNKYVNYFKKIKRVLLLDPQVPHLSTSSKIPLFSPTPVIHQFLSLHYLSCLLIRNETKLIKKWLGNGLTVFLSNLVILVKMLNFSEIKFLQIRRLKFSFWDLKFGDINFK